MMTSRQRVLMTIAHEEPDRVPFNFRLAPDLLAQIAAQVGTDAYAEYFQHDVRYVNFAECPRPDGVTPCDWTPLPSDDEMARVAAEVDALHQRGLAVCGGYACGVFEQAKDWLGDVETLIGPYEDPGGFGALLDRITAWKSAHYAAYAAAGVDIVWMGDDLGTQRSLVMQLPQYRAWYRPRHQQIIAAIRAVRSDVKIAFHSCGHVTPLLPDFIDLGLDILEAVQAETMDIAALKREFGRDITFWGAVGAQSVLQGTPTAVEDGVRQVLQTMAPGGGYIAAPCHTLTQEVPCANVLSFHAAIERYGAYPV